jgi:hypothetical protein
MSLRPRRGMSAHLWRQPRSVFIQRLPNLPRFAAAKHTWLTCAVKDGYLIFAVTDDPRSYQPSDWLSQRQRQRFPYTAYMAPDEPTALAERQCVRAPGRARKPGTCEWRVFLFEASEQKFT